MSIKLSFPKDISFLVISRSILALKTKRKNAHGLFIVGSYHNSFPLSVPAAQRCLDLIHKQRILSDKLCAESAAKNIPNFMYDWIYKINYYDLYKFGKSLTGALLFVI